MILNHSTFLECLKNMQTGRKLRKIYDCTEMALWFKMTQKDIMVEVFSFVIHGPNDGQLIGMGDYGGWNHHYSSNCCTIYT